MGKINEYRRGQLASSAAGVAPTDKSGQIIGSSVQKLGAGLITRAQKMDTYNTLQANTAVMQFGLSFQKLAAQEQIRMASDPGEYPDRIMKDGNSLLTQYASGIEDKAVRQKFMAAGLTIVKAGVFQAQDWAVKKKADNARVASKDAFRIGAIASGSTLTKDALMKSLNTLSELGQDEKIRTVLSEPEIEAEFKKHGPGVLDSHFSNRVMNDAEQLIKDLKADDYADVPYYTSAMKTKYIKQAESHIRTEKTRINNAQNLNYAEASDAFLADQLTFSQIDTLATAPEKEDGISARQAVMLKTSLVLRAENNGNDLYKKETDARKYIDLVKAVKDDRVERAEITTQIVDAYTMGFASRQESQFFSKTLAELKTTKGAMDAQEWSKSVEYIEGKAQQMWGKDTTTAGYVREFVAGVAAGSPPAAAAQMVLRKMANTKVIEDNPNLATSEDPIPQTFEDQARSDLKAGGYKVDEKRVKTLAESLKAQDGRK